MYEEMEMVATLVGGDICIGYRLQTLVNTECSVLGTEGLTLRTLWE